MKPSTLVILGSSRQDSNTLNAVQKLLPFPNYDLVDLQESRIAYYSYESSDQGEDDFHPIARKMLEYENIVFATPVYWYTMSGQMKVFFDRLTELTAAYKPIGKALKGKRVFLIASGASPEMPEGFEIPFKHTAEYFDMEFVQSYYQRGR